MKSREHHVSGIPTAYKRLGGRGMTSTIISKEVPAQCDALGPENILVMAAGYLTGTRVINSSRLSIGAKSPLTGGIKESNAGGSIGAALGKLGIGVLLIDNIPDDNKTWILHFNAAGDLTFHSADPLRGMRTYNLVENLQGMFGHDVAVLCIGPAGERKLKSASIQSTDVDGRPCRSAARGGLGAVMGSKGIKAIVVDPGGKSVKSAVDQQLFDKALKEFTKALKNDPMADLLKNLGTPGTVAPVNTMGAFPAYNAREGVFDRWENISGETLAGLLKKRGGKTGHQGCSKCILRCSNDFRDQNGSYQTSSLEYETIWAMGGMLGIDDLDVIAKLDFLCDDIGVDTLNVGTGIAVAMDSGHREFGDGNAALKMVEEIAEATDMGILLGHGPAEVGKHFNNKRVPVVKNQSIAGYDPRGMQGNGVTYATSPMGADHTAGNLIEEYEKGRINPLNPEGQVEASREVQIFCTFLDCTGLCLFAGLTLVNSAPEQAFYRLMTGLLGERFDKSSIREIGLQTLKLEIEFNRKAGLTRTDDRLPDFLKSEPLPPHNRVFLIEDEDLDSVFEW